LAGEHIMLYVAFLIATVILMAMTLLPLWRCDAWWVRSLDFPRLQLAAISVLVGALALLLLDPKRLPNLLLVLAAGCCFVYQVRWILPYTRLFAVEVAPTVNPNRPGTIRILTANVLTSNRHAAALIELVHEYAPDILVTMESDAWWQKQLDILEAQYPHTIKCPLDNLYGMHLYSKLELTDSHIEYLVESDVPSIHTLAALPCGENIRFHFLHPAPPSPTEKESSSERDAELVIVARSVAQTDEPVIVTGDLNDVAWSETTRLFRKISGLLDPRVGRGMFNTFHADYWFMRWPLDHLFHSGHFTLSRICRLGGFGSDHFALFTELVLDQEKDRKRHHLEVNEGDRQWAGEKAAEQSVSSDDVPDPGKK
jgi:endonuclease/exonuclease/phosphatase (EEP) superfamily protein YafD